MDFTIENIDCWNGVRNRLNTYSFSIPVISELFYTEEFACSLEYFINDEKHIFSDQFNIEYMGYLTGHTKCTKEELINYINEFIKNQL